MRAISKVLVDLSDRVGLRTEQVRLSLGIDAHAFRSYSETARARLQAVGALNILTSTTEAALEREEAAMDAMNGTGEASVDASEIEPKGKTDDVRRFFNNVLIGLDVASQRVFKKHLILRLLDVNAVSTHARPAVVVYQQVSSTLLNGRGAEQGGVHLVNLLGLIPFASVVNLVSQHGGNFYASPDGSSACAVVRILQVTWRVNPKECVPHARVPYMYTETTLSAARRVWGRQPVPLLLLRGVPVSRIRGVKAKASRGMVMRRVAFFGGGSMLGLVVHSADVAAIKRHFIAEGDVYKERLQLTIRNAISLLSGGDEEEEEEE